MWENVYGDEKENCRMEAYIKGGNSYYIVTNKYEWNASTNLYWNMLHGDIFNWLEIYIGGNKTTDSCAISSAPPEYSSMEQQK